MSIFLCKLWPYLAGGLIGWLLSGWLARKLKYGKPPIEKIVEKKIEVQKFVDNPKHIERIGLLEKENAEIATLRSQLVAFENTKPKVIEKTIQIDKVVDNPKHLKRISELEKENDEITSLRAQITKLESSNSTTTAETNTSPNKLVDNPELQGRILELENENKKIATLEAKLKEFETKQNTNLSQVSRIADLENQLAKTHQAQTIDIKAARAAGISINSENDLTAIEGIGPKINDIIQAEGIKSFKILSDTNPTDIKNILDDAGPRYRLANPGTWPDQANLAANNRWSALKALQDVLDGGVYPSNKGSSVTHTNDSNKDQGKRISELEKELAQYKKKAQESKITSTKVDTDAAKAAGFKLKSIETNGHHDFTVIEGIGPKINELIHNDKIHTYAELADTAVEAIQKILDDAGPRYKLADPGTWPAQSEMAANNQWAELKKWQDELDGGIA